MSIKLKPLTDGRTSVLLRYVRANQQTKAKVRDILIHGHLRLAYKIAKRHFKRDASYNDDLVGIASLTLVESVCKIIEPSYPLTEDFNGRMWISHYIELNLRAYVVDSQQWLVHRETFRKRLQQGKSSPNVICTDLIDKFSVDRSDHPDLKSSLKLILKNNRERLIVSRLESGENFAQIGQELCVHRERIRQIVNSIRDRLSDYISVETYHRRSTHRRAEVVAI